MAEIRYLENRHGVIFSAEGGPIWIKFRRLLQNNISTAVMLSKSKPVVEFHYADVWANSVACHPGATCHTAGCCHLANSMSWFQSYVSHCRVLPPGEFNAYLPKATYHIAGCCHLVNSLSRFQSHMPHCRVQSPGEINVTIVPHCRV